MRGRFGRFVEDVGPGAAVVVGLVWWVAVLGAWWGLGWRAGAAVAAGSFLGSALVVRFWLQDE